MIYIFLIVFFTLNIAPLSQSSITLLPIYDPASRCHHLTLSDYNLTFAICLQSSTGKHYADNQHTASKFCSTNYPPNGHLIDLVSLSPFIIDQLFQGLTNLYNSQDSNIDLSEPYDLWTGSNFTQNFINKNFWCPEKCHEKNESTQGFLIINLQCSFNNDSKPCISTKSLQLDWSRASFVCVTNQIIKNKRHLSLDPVHIAPSYSNDTIISRDSNSCLLVRTQTHQYTFCFRRQSCQQSKKSAFCSAKYDAYRICQEEKNDSNLLTIENDDEYRLVSDIITRYSNESVLNEDGIMTNKRNTPAQWMWINGMKNSNNVFQWNISNHIVQTITEKYWCDNMMNCSGGRTNDHVVLSMSCQMNNHTVQVCLTSKRRTEPAPFICKRTLKENEKTILNQTSLQSSTSTTTTTTTTITSTVVVPVYEKNSTLIYYDEHHCLIVESRTHIYTFCLRRQNCTSTLAYCTKWSQAQKDCRLLKNHSDLLTIENDQERILITDIMQNYSQETRLKYNGSSNKYFPLSDFVWIDGVQQADTQTYLWNKERESIPEHLWCSKNDSNLVHRDRVMLNLVSSKNKPLICLGTRLEWNLAPYICKRKRTQDPCPIIMDNFSISSTEMFIVAINRTVIFIKCRNPEYSKDIKSLYQCDVHTKQWKVIYTHNNFTCPDYDIPPIARSTSEPQTTDVSTTTQTTYSVQNISNAIIENDCSQEELLSIINNLPTQYNNIYSENITHPTSSLYYQIKLTCYHNHSIQIIYQCNLLTKKWIYVHGNTNRFYKCYPPCSRSEQNALLNKYFTQYEQTKIRTKYIKRTNSLRLSCFNTMEKRWKWIRYRCDTMTITTQQWFTLHSCFQYNTLSTTQSPFVVSLWVNEKMSRCPPVVVRGSSCEKQLGLYLYDENGCKRKVCPSLSNLCNTIRCPPDYICRVIPCSSCSNSDYLQPVCEDSSQTSLCELQKKLPLLNDYESINRWEHEAITIVQRYAREKRLRLT